VAHPLRQLLDCRTVTKHTTQQDGVLESALVHLVVCLQLVLYYFKATACNSSPQKGDKQQQQQQKQQQAHSAQQAAKKTTSAVMRIVSCKHNSSNITGLDQQSAR
jgi:hypothetical protein